MRRKEEHAMIPIKTILHPTDFSDHSECALWLTDTLAREHGARVILLHVLPPPVSYGEVIARAGPDGYKDQLWRVLEDLKPPNRAAAYETRLADGDAAHKIVEVPQEEKVNLIVMGTHGRTGLRRVVLGSVAEHVLRHSPCPVLTIKGPLPATRVEPAASETVATEAT
jgi:nucleotide-binding universal stress UspA family protein